ncbi:pyrroloquinoline quinone precursor peptide PqqA [Streptomyces alboniger]|uniref:Coenzyme PQQ synthesis protein A n=2 Tax=Streptomyces alboniger TaxID=132473 RepID=A0A5J6HQU6_STRAD|nr:pyrroloquinoline quinone precursor peptide PqqA [Streptomyces alboniger]
MPAIEQEHSSRGPHGPHGPQEPATEAADWQTPAYAVVDTALEVTAYRLADR